MAFKPTESQKQAINTQGNILVSAAAGSGKTAVLVERVIKKLTDKENPTRADELLIVTFTNAAAAEMRTRIEKRLEEECANNPDDTGLLLQKHLLNSAKICTIDSFCIDLVRENFDKLGIEPDFKIGDANDLKQINEEVLYTIINRYFSERDPLFYELLNLVGSDFDERNFAQLILSVYDFSRQLPFPQKWYNEILENYNNGVFSRDNLWYKYAFKKAKDIIFAMEKSINVAIEHISIIEKAYNAYISAFSDARDKIQVLKEKADTNDWDTLFEALSKFELLRLPVVRGVSDYSEISAAKDIYKHLNGKALEPLYKLFYGNFSFINAQFIKLYPLVKLFIEILKEFDNNVFLSYKEQKIFTFHNTEHLALQLLCKEENGIVTVSENGEELLQQYKEVMVDEYQDTNDLQDMLFYVLSDFERKLFVVGDVKQSIYAFRGANPSNFLRKKQNYVPLQEAQNNKSQKIILGNNFRSKAEICDFVNYFFGLFMQKETGSIVYDKEEMLISAATFPKTESATVTFDLIDRAETDESAITLEAISIANFIKTTMQSKPCIKESDNNLRKARFGDFTILLRAVSNKAPALVAELESQGIPVNLSINNFSQSVEVETFLSLLRVIDNPKNDIALATVMMSPMFGFSTDSLAEIRIKKDNGDLYSAVIFSAKNGNAFAKEFLEKIENYRLKSVTLPLSKLVLTLLIETEYLNLVSSMPDGEQRRNNLLLLCDLANNFVSEKSRSLSAFADYVIKLSSVGAVSGESNAVKIMSIHASKGLQFPVCIIAACESRFNDAEARNTATYSTKYGLGFKYFDETDSKKYTTLSREVILDDIKTSALEEELRLLYVAMTRAQDKLHFVASFSDFNKSLQGYKDLLLSSNCAIDKNIFMRTKSYSDWLLLSLLLHPESGCLSSNDDGILPIETTSHTDIRIVNGSALVKNSDKVTPTENGVNNDLVSLMKNNFEYEYPYNKLMNIQSKMSVSVLANKAESDKYAFTTKPSFMSKDGVTATGRGTAMHKIIEFFDFSKTDFIEEEIDRLYEWQFITEEEKNSLDINALKSFFNSDIFKRILNARHVEREMRFLTEIPASNIDNTLEENLKDEKIIIQGAVDICFIENDQLVILDFKTDRVGDIEDLAVSYGEQLSAYAMACEKIFGLKVKEKLIYSFQKQALIAIK